MKIILKYSVVFLLMICFFGFSLIKQPHIPTNKKTTLTPLNIDFNQLLNSNSSLDENQLGFINAISGPLRSEKHKTGKTSKSTLNSILIETDGNESETVDYYEIVIYFNEGDEEATDTIYVLHPSLKTGNSLYFRTQPIKIKHASSIEEIDEVVEVSNQKYESEQCHKIIKGYKELQDSLNIAYQEDGKWKEKMVYLPYHRLSFEDDSEAIYRPYEFFNTNDPVIYITETFVIESPQKTISVSKWCNSDGYPHVINNAKQDDHFDPIGCN